ncbi:MAG: hypothetical protein GXP00_07305 [Alphaproteobacteria bacterium]|nr:hypothetical protein [Alphaproteobacteria bacterium]
MTETKIRRFIALLFAPALAGLIVFIIPLSVTREGDIFVGSFNPFMLWQLIIIIGTPLTLVLGIPAEKFLINQNKNKLYHYAIAGFVSAFIFVQVPRMFMYIKLNIDFELMAFEDLSDFIFDPSTGLYLYMGVVTATVFRLIRGDVARTDPIEN